MNKWEVVGIARLSGRQLYLAKNGYRGSFLTSMRVRLSQGLIPLRAEGPRNCTRKTGPCVEHPVANQVSIFADYF
jgi:hypothetical protein